MNDLGLTGRDHLMIAQALFVAAKALRAQPHPPNSDICDMERLMRELYPSHLRHFDLMNDLKRAVRLGFKPTIHGFDDEPGAGPSLEEEVKEFLGRHPPSDDNVIALFDPEPKG